MKNKLLILIIASLMVLPSLSFAQSGESTTETNTVKERSRVRMEERIENTDSMSTERREERESMMIRIKEKREELKQELEQKREGVRNKIEERKQNIADKMVEKMDEFIQKVIERLNSAANRLDILVIRIQSRIDKIKAANIDTAEAEKLLATAKTKIETAKSTIALITLPEITTDTSSTNTGALRAAFETTRTQIEAAKNALKDAHAALVDVINTLKPGDNKLKNSSDDSTTETEN